MSEVNPRRVLARGPLRVEMIGDELTRATRLRVGSIGHRVFHIGHLAREFRFENLRRVRERVREIAREFTEGDDEFLHVLVVSDETGVFASGGDHLRAGERRHVDDESRRARARGIGDVGDAVGQHETALGVGVVNLDRLSALADENVVGTNRTGADGVLGDAQDEIERRRERAFGVLSRDGFERAEHPRGAGHVRLHAAHAIFRLER